MGCQQGKPMHHESSPKKATDSTTEHATAFTFLDAVAAVSSGNVEKLNKIQKNSKFLQLLNQKDEDGYSLGDIAIERGKPECLAFMLRFVSTQDYEDDTALVRYCNDLKPIASRYQAFNEKKNVHTTIINALNHPQGRILTTEPQDSNCQSSQIPMANGGKKGKPMHESSPKKATDSTTKYATAFTFLDAVNAVSSGNIETLNKIQKNYKCRHILNQLDEDGACLGHIAIQVGKPECLAFMLRLVSTQDLVTYCHNLKPIASRYQAFNEKKNVHTTIINALNHPQGRILTTDPQD
jgi:hypothetical protein